MDIDKEMNKGKILVVDDEPCIVDLLTANLSYEGFEVFSAFRGDEALVKARETKPDLILLDIMIPEPNGIEVCSILKKNGSTKNIPVIMLTCLRELDTRVKSFKAGAIDYVTKPFLHGELIASIKKTLLPDILLVDDCEELSFAIKIWLEEKGYNITVASDGNEAIDFLNKSTYDLILLDYNLGAGPDGLDVYKFIKDKDLSSKILFITSEVDNRALDMAMTYKDFRLLRKPFSLTAMDEEINSILTCK